MGTDEEIMYKQYKEVYSHCYPTFGNLDDIHACIDYLQDKPKFLKWRAEMEKVEKGTKKSHPTGKKVVQQEKVMKNSLQKRLPRQRLK
jgi:hypothetical protein